MLDGYMMLYGIYLYLSDLCGIWMMLDGNPLVMTNPKGIWDLSDLCGIWMMLDGNPLVMTNGLLCSK
jgi:hypothetical protein